MPGMWELLQLKARAGPSLMKIRHSITMTDWTVEVFEGGDPDYTAQWTRISKLSTLPLTGLTRKILLKLKMLA